MEIIKNKVSTRKEIVKYTKKVLIGPGSEKGTHSDDFEIISENPLQRYVTGMIFPVEKQEGVLEEEKERLTGLETDFNVIDNDFYPKSFGFTFYSKDLLSEVTLKYTGAFYLNSQISKVEIPQKDFDEFLIAKNRYEEIDEFLDVDSTYKSISLKKGEKFVEMLEIFNKEKRANKWNERANIVLFSYLKKLERFYKNGCFIRSPFQKKIKIHLDGKVDRIISINDEICVRLFVNVKKVYLNERKYKSITIVIQNVSNKVLFQNELSIQIDQGDILVSAEELSQKEYKRLSIDERQNMLLYRNQKTYAVGHGISVQWENDNSGKITRIFTNYLPQYEVKQMKFIIDSEFLERNKDKVELELVKFMLQAKSYIDDNKIEQLKKLRHFVSLYEIWIEERENEIDVLPNELLDIAWDNVKKCRESVVRMKKGIEFLESDVKALQAFKWAQEAMILQRMSNVEEKQERFKNKNYNHKILEWRPFQLAFILNSLESILNEQSEERMVLDLIWVSTGGGKTEAYLFAIAISIFYRRLTHPSEKDGVSVIMRYTLRLLTAQQFERASALICACEFIRNHNSNVLGMTEISIGLWVGGSSTPNTRKNAKDSLKKLMSKNNLSDAKAVNDFQILKCPWCKEEDSLFPSEENIKKRAHIYWGIHEASRFNKFHNFHCTNSKCYYHKQLPIHVVDEEIYFHRPTVLFGTVDKFARVPLDKRSSNLFGTDNSSIRRPELVIQDELHLISGPLGSIVGLYEAAFDHVLSNVGVHPKYIASTATIKNAEEQVENLFNRKVQQFPPAGINADDNYFVTIDDEKPGRVYMGVMPTGKTQITTEIRLVSALIQSISDLDITDDERELYWTVTGYFNSIRELGKMTTLIKDDIDDYLLIMRQRNIEKKRNINNPVELTSRVESTKIKDIIDQLEKNHKEKDSVDILTATNMLSVGIDISRLNLMFVVGQPKTTSEYIQATSRVGRNDPGLVWILYNSTRSRDRSHYETFQSYHQSMYRFVEPTSVTPYSLPALKKGLPAVLTTILRNIKKENVHFAQNISREEMLLAKNFLLQRISDSDKLFGLYSEDAEKKIIQLLDEWKRMINSNKKIEYFLSTADSINKDTSNVEFILKDTGVIMHPEAKQAMNSMRDVDQSAYINIIE